MESDNEESIESPSGDSSLYGMFRRHSTDVMWADASF